MNKRIFALLLGAVFVVSTAYAERTVTVANYTIKGANGQKADEPARVLKRVRFAFTNLPAVVSGDVVVYDTQTFDDGVTIRKTTTSADGSVAGIAVTAIQTADSGAETTLASVDAQRASRNWGYILIHGPIQAKISAGGGNSCSAGDIAYTSSDSGAVTGLDSVAGTAATGALVKKSTNGFGFFMDACDGSATLQKVFVENE